MQHYIMLKQRSVLIVFVEPKVTAVYQIASTDDEVEDFLLNAPPPSYAGVSKLAKFRRMESFNIF